MCSANVCGELPSMTSRRGEGIGLKGRPMFSRTTGAQDMNLYGYFARALQSRRYSVGCAAFMRALLELAVQAAHPAGNQANHLWPTTTSPLSAAASTAPDWRGTPPAAACACCWWNRT